ncbi:MAG: diaminopropionate ammonia-lyase [Desulforhopalus sp.]
MLIDIPEYRFQALMQDPQPIPSPREFNEEITQKVHSFHRQLPGYKTTRLVSLKELAQFWNIGDIFVKDESTRFDLKAFKVLGGSYAVARLICQKLDVSMGDTDYEFLTSAKVRRQIGRLTFTTATDGNHGRGVAWAAEQLGQEAIIFMPKGTAQSRIDNIASHGAQVKVTDLNYDNTVHFAAEMADKNGWLLIQDTAWEQYEEIPLWIMQGYMTMCKEALEQMDTAAANLTHVFVQAGVGALPGAVVGYFLNKFPSKPPRFIIMEPNNAACIFESAKVGDGKPHAVTGDLETIMAGLACGEPNILAWKILRDFSSCFIRCDNYVAANGMRILANPVKGDCAIEAGESGAVGIGLLDLLASHRAFRDLKEKLQIGPNSTLLFFNTEGATDPVSYRKILWYGKYPALTPSF